MDQTTLTAALSAHGLEFTTNTWSGMTELVALAEGQHAPASYDSRDLRLRSTSGRFAYDGVLLFDASTTKVFRPTDYPDFDAFADALVTFIDWTLGGEAAALAAAEDARTNEWIARRTAQLHGH